MVIKDPWQVRLAPTKEEKSEPWRIIWFGSNKSVRYLCHILPGLLQNKALNEKYELTILGSEFSLSHVQSFIPRQKHIQPLDASPNNLESSNSRNNWKQNWSGLTSRSSSDPTDPLTRGTSHNQGGSVKRLLANHKPVKAIKNWPKSPSGTTLYYSSHKDTIA